MEGKKMSYTVNFSTGKIDIQQLNKQNKRLYIGGGFQFPNDKGKVFWFGFDEFTCLIPLKDNDDNDVYINDEIKAELIKQGFTFD
jgi:hypothetical protein